jgi:O-antigen ligase
MAALALLGVVLGFGRAVFAATAVVCVLLVALSGPVRTSLVSVIPLALPFLVLAGIALYSATPDLVNAARERVSAPPDTDANVQWREKANEAVFAQVREQPLIGVGFGRTSSFFLGVPSDNGVVVPVRVDINQDPHDGYLFLWAGGGLAALGSFALILVAAAYDGTQRFRRTSDPTARVLLLWSAGTLFAFLLNAASGTSFEAPSNLLMIWLLLSIPAVVVGQSRSQPTARAVPPGDRPDGRSISQTPDSHSAVPPAAGVIRLRAQRDCAGT